ncbi:MAG: hypothetical protein KGO48_17300 [Alphaproteobacteria bacterium]|nr:hypothetical protein [Alphaproteobacteria bacterium]
MLKYGIAALGLVLFAALPAVAHHSDAMFDSKKEVVLNGTVKEFQYTNPHSWIQVLVPGAAGAGPVEWSIETAAPIVLLRAGIKPSSLQPGDKISLRMHPLKSGAPGGSLVEVKKDDGTTLSLRGPSAY